ncbi:MAG: FkbM family methyltransferase [Parvularculaceae bacterium]
MCCIDVGAASGTKTIYEAFPEAFHIVFEPLPDFHDALAETMAQYRHEIHLCGLMETSGDRSLLRHPDRYGSSLMHKRRAGSQNIVNVPVRTLDEVIGGRQFPGGMLLKTDCQGSDLFVLKGGEQTLLQADVIIVEASLFRFWGAHHPDIYEIMQFMRARNFVLYDVLDGLFRPSDSALGQLDLAFVREGGPFRESAVW